MHLAYLATPLSTSDFQVRFVAVTRSWFFFDRLTKPARWSWAYNPWGPSEGRQRLSGRSVRVKKAKGTKMAGIQEEIENGDQTV